MNVERILQLADTVESLEPAYRVTRSRLEDEDGEELTDFTNRFLMSRFRFACGSPACIAGWAAWLANQQKDVPGDTWDRAKKYLELDNEDMALHLFAPSPIDGVVGADMMATSNSSKFITPNRAAAVLRNLAETGEVDWSI